MWRTKKASTRFFVVVCLVTFQTNLRFVLLFLCLFVLPCPSSTNPTLSRILRLPRRPDCRGKGLRVQLPRNLCSDAAGRDCVPHRCDRRPARVPDRGDGHVDCRAKVLEGVRQGKNTHLVRGGLMNGFFCLFGIALETDVM